ncbi:MAG: c-type cytochrome [Candidatus Manganitrophus sp.]|nr:c-type cytochrome [Candidatus Manganitrophus sp.]
MTDEGKALVAYLQKLGTQIGDWREAFLPISVNRRVRALIRMRKCFEIGKRVYARRCVGCHGEKGDGNGPSARFFVPKPRDFTRGIFKFRSTGGEENTLPLDADLYRTVTHGLWGTAMPAWYEISELERAVGHSIHQNLFRSMEERGRSAADFYSAGAAGRTPQSVDRGRSGLTPRRVVSAATGRREKGTARWRRSCAMSGGNPVRPANLTFPAGAPGGVKLGHDARHLFHGGDDRGRRHADGGVWGAALAGAGLGRRPLCAVPASSGARGMVLEKRRVGASAQTAAQG